MEEKKVSTLFEDIRDDVSSYITGTIELGKLEVYEKISIGSAATAYGLIIAGAFLFAFVFVFVTVAFYLAEILHSTWMGFGIVAAAAILSVLIMLLLRKAIKRMITNRVVSFLMKKDGKEAKK
jgi:membrane protein implicated in regulation of membrane protease activity